MWHYYYLVDERFGHIKLIVDADPLTKFLIEQYATFDMRGRRKVIQTVREKGIERFSKCGIMVQE